MPPKPSRFSLIRRLIMIALLAVILVLAVGKNSVAGAIVVGVVLAIQVALLALTFVLRRRV